MDNILIFDGVCNLCNKFVQFIIRHDAKAKFKFAPLQSEAGRKLIMSAGLDLNQTDSVVLLQSGRPFLKSAAALRVLRDLGGIWKLGYAFMIVPAPLRNFIYDLVARSRYRVFGKREECMIPTAELQERFL